MPTTNDPSILTGRGVAAVSTGPRPVLTPPGPPHDCSEKEFQCAVEELADLFGWRSYHTRDSRRSAKGFPDCVMVRRGRLVFAELKTARGRVRPEQQAWVSDLMGCLTAGSPVGVYVWRPDQWDDIVRVLT